MSNANIALLIISITGIIFIITFIMIIHGGRK